MLLPAYSGYGLVPAANFRRVLEAESTVNQSPSALDTPIDVSFGPAVNSAVDDVMIDANGVITISRTGYYKIIVTLDIGRQGTSGTAFLFTRTLIDPTGAAGFIISAGVRSYELGNSNYVGPTNVITEGVFDINAKAKMQIGRDSNNSGANDGGLFSLDSTGGLGWGGSASARIAIYRYGE